MVHLTDYIDFVSVFPAGSLGEWLADHPPMLGGILPVVLQALTNPDLSLSSVSALKRICRECRYNLQPHADNILAATQVSISIPLD